MGLIGKTCCFIGKAVTTTAKIGGKVLVFTVEAFLASGEKQMTKYSKDKSLSEEQRERAKEYADQYATAHDAFSEKFGKEK